MIRFATRVFIKGLVVVLPIMAAVYVVLWMVRDSEALVKGLLLAIMPEDYIRNGCQRRLQPISAALNAVHRANCGGIFERPGLVHSPLRICVSTAGCLKPLERGFGDSA
jgi:uncharacterized membrane protein